MRYSPPTIFNIFNMQRGQRPQQRAPNHDYRSSYAQDEPAQRMMANYRLIRKLKPGGMSIAINIVEHKSSGDCYIEKQIVNNDPNRAEAEIATLRQISPYARQYNLNSMFQYAPGHRAIHVILEYCEGGNLQDLTVDLKARDDRHPEGFVWHVLISCINALGLLHNGPVGLFGQHDPNWDTICHLDIKPENIYLQSIGESYPRIVLGDFGGSVSNSAIYRGRADPQSTPAYTPGWEAPETKEGRYGTKTDSWQLGCSIQAMCLLRPTPDLEALKSDYPCGRRYSRELNSFVSALTATNIYRRQNAEEMMAAAQRNARGTMLWDRRLW